MVGTQRELATQQINAKMFESQITARHRAQTSNSFAEPRRVFEKNETGRSTPFESR